jgi:hypothetical protein
VNNLKYIRVKPWRDRNTVFLLPQPSEVDRIPVLKGHLSILYLYYKRKLDRYRLGGHLDFHTCTEWGLGALAICKHKRSQQYDMSSFKKKINTPLAILRL